MCIFRLYFPISKNIIQINSGGFIQNIIENIINIVFKRGGGAYYTKTYKEVFEES